MRLNIIHGAVIIIPRPPTKGKKKVTYRQLWDQWIAKRTYDLCESTIIASSRNANVYILPYIGSADLGDITASLLQPVMDNASPEANKVLMQVLRYGVKFGVGCEVLSDIHYKHRPRASAGEAFTLAEINLLIKAARPDWFRDMVIIAFRTGMRRGELLALKWEDIDFDLGYLQVRRSLVGETRDMIQIRAPKCGSFRRIRLCDTALLTLMERKEHVSSDFVFTLPPDNRLIVPNNVSHNMVKACNRAGVRRRRFHDLRHTHATMLISRGVPLTAVSERMGHTDLTTTLRTYTHVIPDIQKVAVDILNDL